MSYEVGLLGFAALVAVGILLHHPSRTLGVPSLLIFMGVGLLIGNGEFNFDYDNLQLTSSIGTAALNIIVFVGGLNTSMGNIRVAWREGGMLSSIGVLLTIGCMGLMMNLIFDMPLILCFLFAAIVSSTDAAAVFSILESKKLKLKEHTDTVLEFESATNDPIAMIMVLLLTQMALNSELSLSTNQMMMTLCQQVFIGVAGGYLVGQLGAWLLNQVRLPEFGQIPVFILCCFVLAAYGTAALGGNILIAAYVAGVILGNNVLRGMEVSRHFFNSLAWLAQSLMFVVLGLQLSPQQLWSVLFISLLPAILLMLIARPLAVWLCYLPFRKVSKRKRVFISAIGLRGATPIVFALIPAAAGVSGGVEMKHMVFFTVLISILFQGSLLEPLARKLDLIEEPKK
ncbi:potassium/proton antiporter [Corallincola platygyrae]|uniref:Potassium/proton antiporter n=1 Tax=Corallincola platygyrae TaxID=1193278 RepID=A0ABW4XL97_9GAMM